jgi:hypothetical protein
MLVVHHTLFGLAPLELSLLALRTLGLSDI